MFTYVSRGLREYLSGVIYGVAWENTLMVLLATENACSSGGVTCPKKPQILIVTPKGDM